MYIYGKRWPTSKAIAEKLGCKVGRRLTRVRKRGMIINWGYGFDFEACPHVINRKIVVNKCSELRILREQGIKTPEINSFPTFPMLGRDYRHTQGRDIVKYNDLESWEERENLRIHDFYTEYIDKKGEYRVHVLGDNVPCITKKKRMEDEEQNELIWNYDNGWKQIKYNESGRYWDELAELGKSAVKALGYDFGAVDIIVGQDETLYVLEVNTAPGLIEDRIDMYVEYFRGLL